MILDLGENHTGVTDLGPLDSGCLLFWRITGARPGATVAPSPAILYRVVFFFPAGALLPATGSRAQLHPFWPQPPALGRET